MKEEYFFPTSLPTNTTSSEIFKAIHDYIVGKCQIEFKYCVGVCTHGASALTGRRSGVVNKIKDLASECKFTHCEDVKIVNYVKTNPLKIICCIM